MQFRIRILPILWLASLIGLSYGVHADAPLAPPQLQKRWSQNHQYLVASDPQSNQTKAYTIIKGHRKLLWSISEYFTVVDLANDGRHLVTGYGGYNLLPLDYKKSLELLRFYNNGHLLRTVTVGDLFPSRSKLTRTVSHYEWGNYAGFDKKGHYIIKTNDGRTIAYDVTTGRPLK